MATKIKEIPISGLSTSPSDIQADDGNLAIATNILHEDGRIIVYPSPEPILDCGSGYVIYKHDNDSFSHYIIRQGNKYFWKESDGTASTELTDLDGIDVKNVVAVGNTIIFYSDIDSYTFTFADNAYQFLGSKLPEIKIKTYIKTVIKPFTDDTNHSEFDTGCEDHAETMSMLTDLTVRNRINDVVFGKINEMIEDSHKNKKFVMPFIVRMAYRLYDGSITMHSSPIMMIPSMDALPMAEYFKDTQKFNVMYNEATLMYSVPDLVDFKESLAPWHDIIKEIIFATSAPIYTFDQTEQIKTTKTEQYWIGNDFMISSPGYEKKYYWKTSDDPEHVEEESETVVGTFYMPCAKRKILPFCSATNQVFSLPKNSRSIVDRVSEVSNFYVVSSINVNDLQQDAEVPITDTLQSIYNKEAISDDFESHDSIIPAAMVSYNNRLNVAAYKKYCYNNCYLWGFESYQSTEHYVEPEYHPEEGQFVTRTTTFQESRVNNEPVTFGMAVCISNNGRSTSSIVRINIPEQIPSDFAIPYFFYPNTYAKRMYVRKGNTVAMYSLREHDSLNGSFLCNPVFEIDPNYTFQMTDTNLSAEETSVIAVLNGEDRNTVETYSGYIKTSDVSNPFVFTAANVEQIGNGTIIALAPAAQALSNGQFGDFPMYAFTTEGIWALSVSDTGGWQSKQPISRDVALSASSILQTDQSVIFATERGLMQITGSTVTCISEIFDGLPDQFAASYPEHLRKVYPSLHDIDAFKQFLHGSNMHYAYRPQRIYIGNPSYAESYVFSMKDRLWTTVPLQITSAVNSYPDALAMIQNPDHTSSLVNLSEDGTTNTVPGYLLTRPIQFDDPHSLKTVRTIALRGVFDRTHVRTYLYASRDLTHWLHLASAAGPRIQLAHGTPFRAFRVAVIASLAPDEYLTTMSIEYEDKLTNKLR